MKTKHHNEVCGRKSGSWVARRRDGVTLSAFTLLEVLITMGLVMVLVGSSMAALLFLNRSSARLADYTAAMALVHGQMEMVRAAAYNPPTYPFTAAQVQTNFQASIALSKSGTNYLVSGTVTAVITPDASGHLVTVTGTFPALGSPVTVSLQSFVNRFAGGQQ